MADDASPVLSQRDGAVLTLTLNRPQALNSFTGALHDALMSALKAAAGDASVRCVVLTGAGRGFCAGQDLSDPAIAPDLTPGAAPKDIGNLIEARYKPLALQICDFPVPVVAAVNGVAAGAGANLALNCDIVLAARSASFIQAFCRIGLVPDSGGTFFLPRLVGMARATSLAMLADRLPAQRALEWGMIYDVVPSGVLLDTATDLARQLATQPTRGLGLIKRALNASWENDLARQLALEEELQREAGRTADYLEGVRAFQQKRAPVFLGR